MGWIYELAGLWVYFFWVTGLASWEISGSGLARWEICRHWIDSFFFLWRLREALNAAVTRSQTHPSIPQ